MSQVKVLLLRGVNVAGANRLPMPEFRDMLADLGVPGAQTHIQSGNAVFLDPGVAGLTDKISTAMRDRFGFSPAMFMLTLTEFMAVLAANPYAAQGGAEGDKVHVYFLAAPATDSDLMALKAVADPSESFQQKGNALYLLAPNGIGRSVLASKIDKILKVGMTARNQRSVEAIAALGKTIPKA